MTSRRIYFAVVGSGIGHVTRILELSERVRRDGDEFRYSTFGQAVEFLRARGLAGDLLTCPELDVEWTSEGGFAVREFLPHLPLMVNAFVRQLSYELASLGKFRPKVVVSDSRLSSVLAAKLRSIPVVTMLNQFNVAFPSRFGSGAVGRFLERIAGDGLGLLWSLSDQVLMTDLPPPYTIAKANLAGTEFARVLKYVGFTSPRVGVTERDLARAKRALGLDSRPTVFFQVSGPEPTKKSLIEASTSAASTLSGRYNVIISAGRPSGSAEPTRLAGGGLLFDWCPYKDELFEIASILVARAGHSTIGQCIDAGKPAVLAPIDKHTEQIGNAQRFQELGLGLVVWPDQLNGQVLANAVDSCITDPRYASSCLRLRDISLKYAGMDSCVRAVDALA